MIRVIHRMRPAQVEVLESEYLIDPVWTRSRRREIANIIDARPEQVYKWNYDRRQRSTERA